jgi:hypothetical protein
MAFLGGGGESPFGRRLFDGLSDDEDEGGNNDPFASASAMKKPTG